jgi:hypothetical protein
VSAADAQAMMAALRRCPDDEQREVVERFAQFVGQQGSQGFIIR